jgi:pimeloyl-ACP methyl ester carboxylesterase
MNDPPGDPRRYAFSRVDSDFSSAGERCAAWLYLPSGVASPPVVVMGHGFAAQRDFALPAYAEAFASHGYAVLLFDYRGFGASEGSPRQLVSPPRHLEDWQAAVNHAAGLPEVDPSRIALWGSSFGGGHALVTASRRRDVRAVIAQVPYVDSVSTLRRLSVAELGRAIVSGVRDVGRSLAGRPAFTVPVYGEPGVFACMNTPESAAGYAAMVPEDSCWTNACPARIFLTLPLYRPIARVAGIEAAILLLCAEDDSLIPVSDIEACARRNPRVEIVRVPGGHFDVYRGEGFERACAAYLAFLDRHMGPGPASAA